MVVEAVGAILRQDANGVDITVDAVAQRKINNAKLTGKGYSRLARSSDSTVSRVPSPPAKVVATVFITTCAFCYLC